MIDPYIPRLLNVFWLRPETALWRACDIQAMAKFSVQSPSLDLGCGDGIFSFIRAGGELRDDFDVFRSVGRLDEFFENADVFDHFEEHEAPVVIAQPRYKFDVGFDQKRNLLRKASQLSFYAKLVEGDADRALPFASESFASIFSNIIYWLEDPQFALTEVGRVLAPGGQACLMLPSDTFARFSFYGRFFLETGDKRFQFLEKLDRGRLADNIKQCKSDADWRKLFSNAGLRVDHHARHLWGPLVQIWDVGLRPLFPVLKKMTACVEPATLSALKREWVETLAAFARPLVELDAVERTPAESGFHCYIVSRS